MTESYQSSSSKGRRRQLLLVFVGAFVAFLLVASAAYLASEFAIDQNQTAVFDWPWAPDPGIQLTAPPAPFASVDPAIYTVLAYGQGRYEVRPLVVLPGVMPVGAYMPPISYDSLQPTAQARPTVAPYPTYADLAQPEDSGILPTPTPNLSPLGGPPPELYGGDGCAPKGLPSGGLLTQRFHAWHSGVDYGIPIGTPITATHSGIVTFAGWSQIGYGNLVIIANGAFSTYYAHLSRFNVVEGQTVGAGSVIAWSGNTGNSTGPHIHYEVRINDVPVDALTFERRGYPWC